MLSMLHSLENVSEDTIYIKSTLKGHTYFYSIVSHMQSLKIYQYYTLAIEIDKRMSI